jgi:hypothetical protein
MNIQRKHFFQESAASPGAARPGEGGSVTVIFIALLAVMMILVTAEGRALFQLHREVKLLEQQQLKRLNNWQTNSVAVSQPDLK